MQSRRAQRGAALLGLVALLSAIVLTFLLGTATSLAKLASLEFTQRNERLVRDAADRIRAVYEARVAEVDGTPTAPLSDPMQMAAAAGLPSSSVRILSSNRLSNSSEPGLVWRVFLVYVETDASLENPPTLNLTTGAWAACGTPVSECPNQVAVVDGRLIQARLLARTRTQLEENARFLQDYFRIRLLSDPDKSQTLNYFRSPFDPQAYLDSGTCSTTTPAGELGCIDGWLDVASRSAHDRSVLPLPHATNAWGAPIQISNKLASHYQQPPFTMAVRTTALDGTELIVNAVPQM